MYKLGLVIQGPISHRGIDTSENINNIIYEYTQLNKCIDFIVISTWSNQNTESIKLSEYVKITKNDDIIPSNTRGRHKGNHLRRNLSMKYGVEYMIKKRPDINFIYVLRADMYYNFGILSNFLKEEDNTRLFEEVNQKNYLYFPSISLQCPYYVSDISVSGHPEDILCWINSNLMLSHSNEEQLFYLTNKETNNGKRTLSKDIDQVMKYFLYKFVIMGNCSKFKLYRFFPIVYKKPFLISKEDTIKLRGQYTSNNYLDLWEYIFKHSIRPLPIEFDMSKVWFMNNINRGIGNKNFYVMENNIFSTLPNIYHNEIDYTKTWLYHVLRYESGIKDFPINSRKDYIPKNKDKLNKLRKVIRTMMKTKRGLCSHKSTVIIEEQYHLDRCAFYKKNKDTILNSTILNKSI